MASLLSLYSTALNFKGNRGFGMKGQKSRSGRGIHKRLRCVAGELILEEDDVLHTFLKERELNGDFIAKVSDKLWMREAVKFDSLETELISDSTQLEGPFIDENENEGGFLKLTRKNEWLSGDAIAPVNKKMQAKELRDDSERRTRLNLLKYEAIKRELFLLTVSIGSACSGYCLIALSIQAAVSYATGVIFRLAVVTDSLAINIQYLELVEMHLLSCLYLQLLYKHADGISRETVPEIFRQKKLKRIGIRTEDLEDFFERVVKGSSMALSSPRLVIPAAIYGLWGLSQHFADDFFQLTPAMVGLFAYKAAALVQVYRDNEDLQLILPNSSEE